MADKKDFAFNPQVSRRGLFTLGGRAAVSGAVRSALPAAAEEADPLIEEARHFGQAHHFLNSSSEGFLREKMAAHPTLSKYVEHAVRGLKDAESLYNKHGDTISRHILGDD